MRRLLLALTTCLVLDPFLPRAQERQVTPQDWVRAARQHKPGAWDEAARLVAPLDESDLQSLAAILGTALGPRAPGSAAQKDAVLLRGAMLHADVAMLGEYVRPPRPGEAFVIRAEDGTSRGRAVRDPGWDFSRRLLDAVSPAPEAMQAVRLWYRATTAYMARYGWLADAAPQLEHGRRSLPDDPDVLCDSGWLFEELASSRVQAVVAELMQPSRSGGARVVTGDVGVPGPAGALKSAEEFYTLALEANPSHVEARIRRGRVRTLRGRHKDAVADLVLASQSATRPDLRYDAMLFLGSAHEGVGETGAARDAYLRAAELFPKAQSPHLALSRLALGRGDMPGAQRELQAVLRLGSSLASRPDPWWTYHFGSGRQANELLAQIYAMVAATPNTEW